MRRKLVKNIPEVNGMIKADISISISTTLRQDTFMSEVISRYFDKFLR